MHPIERLRYVARASGAPQDVLVAETAVALGAFRDDPSGLVTACRRVVSRQLTSGAMWWLCSRVLCAPDAMSEARAAVAEIEADTTARRLAGAIPPDAVVAVLGWQPLVVEALVRRGDLEALVIDTLGEGSSLCRHLSSRDVECVDVPLAGLAAAVNAADVVVIDISAAGPTHGLGVVGSLAALAVARQCDTSAWGTIGVGRMLPSRVWKALADRLDDDADPWDRPDDVVPLSLLDAVVGPDGLETVEHAVRRTACPIAPELFKPDIT